MNSLVQSGNFERLSRIYLPETLIHIGMYDTKTKEARLVTHSEYQLLTVADYQKYLKNTKGLHIIDDKAKPQEHKPAGFIRYQLHGANEHLAMNPQEDSYADALIRPTTDEDYLEALSNGQLDERHIVKQYVISDKTSVAAVADFKRLLKKQLPQATLPKDDLDNTVLFQTFIPFYRRTIVKAAIIGRPVVYSGSADLPKFLKIFSYLTQPNVVVERLDHNFHVVDGRALFDRLMVQAQLKDGKRDQRIPLVDDVDGRNRRVVDVQNADPKTNKVISVHQFDAVLG
ncbi:hypothetical protein [Secundilactobacillus mixtipabuli]|uniref:Uncharacterized protein n=1 Tax=Secundilactobacillus mixtipabuli TaxID=1435342 RepID=A0A1Z5IAA3_9LACO|nr:hypothetical protein [Secundilactobacillus mixtipabuli]GAW98535.1 hypothetical protein IWT30_00480 [Secundilactobacillus mixtipabuli]